MNEERLTNIEIKLAYLEKTVLELDTVMRDIGQAVDLLRREVARLRDQERADKPHSDKPPHY